uniref:Uncharacterized protein n=1 Tax=Setaria italica TaxID=4555 RepID=K3XU16_SETIT
MTSHWRILRRAVERISYSVGRWRMCNPGAPQLSLRLQQVPLLVVWQLLVLSEGTMASNYRLCWSVIPATSTLYFYEDSATTMLSRMLSCQNFCSTIVWVNFATSIHKESAQARACKVWD